MVPERPPRILMVHNYSSWGGNLAMVRALGCGLPKRGFEVALAAPAGEAYVERFRTAGIPVLDAAIASKHDLGAYRRYGRIIRGGGFDVVHTHTRRADFIAALAGRRSGVKVISTQHGQINLERRSLRVDTGPSARFYSWCLRNLFDRHVGVSAEIAAELRDRCGVRAALVTHIPNGLDAAPFETPPEDRVSFRNEIGVPRWATVATIVASLDSKGHDDLLAAAAEVTRAGVDLRVVAVGEGQWGRPGIEKRARELGLAARVHLLGFRADVPRVLAGSDLFVLPTLSEGLSIAIMEAMAAGLPVVTTAVGGNAELVAEGITGSLVPPADPPALAAAMLALARDPARRRAMGRAGRARVRAEFTLERMVDAYARMYRELLIGG